jgi:hypothetical protein
MRRSITVAIVVVYLGLLPTLAFQGILQYQVLDLDKTPITNITINESANVATNQTIQTTTNQTIQTAPIPIDLQETAIASFTALVTAVVLSYFGFRTWKEIEEIKQNPTGKEEEKK